MSLKDALDVLSFPVDAVRDKMQELVNSPGVLSSLKRFVAAVDWTDPFVLSILTFHALLLTLAVLTRRNQGTQIAILVLCFALVRGGERLNSAAARKWDDVFALASSSSSSFYRPRQNYFDEGGVFWSALVSAPLLLIMLVQLVLYLRSAWHLMIELKVAQLRAAASRGTAASAGGETQKKKQNSRSKKKTR